MSQPRCILTYMSSLDQVMHRLYAAQTHNATLAGAELLNAAGAAADLAVRHGGRLLAADDTGERILGAALVLPNPCEPVNTSQRLDGQTVVLISGAVAGPVGLTQAVARLRSMGAARVHIGVLDGWECGVAGSDTVEPLSADGVGPTGSVRSRKGRRSAA
jgi:hypothetical protein